MESWEIYTKKLVTLMGFSDYKIDIDSEHNHGALYIYDDQSLIKEHLPYLVESFNYVIQLVAKKNSVTPIFLDLNNYRREREGLIGELARAGARKVISTKKELSLPVMNSYERRLVHMELAANPEVRTESIGEGKERYVIIRPLEDTLKQ